MLKATVRNDGAISLPKSLKGKFSPNESLFVETGKDTILLKKAKTLSLSEISKLLKPLGNKITSKEIEAEITAYRKQK